MMQLSILVVSRTASLLNRMCASIDAACSLAAMDAEILCSWNGSEKEESLIKNQCRYDLHIAQRIPYHYSGNMNGLAAKAGGNILLFINDDVILDANTIDSALSLLLSSKNVGLVGGLLRDEHGLLTHAGINFDVRNSPYHLLDRCTYANDLPLIQPGPVAAVTGALQLIRRNDFTHHPFNTNYKRWGEDVELCLDLQQFGNKEVWLSKDVSAIHEAETTRSSIEATIDNSEDFIRVRARCRDFIDHANAAQLRMLFAQQQLESQQLRDLVREDLPRLQAMEAHLTALEQEFGSAEEMRQQRDEDQAVLLSLREERLRLREKLDALETCHR
jgi:hypothetical protein